GLASAVLRWALPFAAFVPLVFFELFDMCVSFVWYAPLRTGSFSHDPGRKSTRISRFVRNNLVSGRSESGGESALGRGPYPTPGTRAVERATTERGRFGGPIRTNPDARTRYDVSE